VSFKTPEATKFKFSCPSCSGHISTTTDFIGTEGICPHCSNQFEVPTQDKAIDEDAESVLVQDEPARDKEPSPPPPPPLPKPSPLDLPLPSQLLSTAPAGKTDTKLCPMCGEEIRAVARKCKHCGEYLDDGNQEKPNDATRGSESSDAHGMTSLACKLRDDALGVIPSLLALLTVFLLGYVLKLQPQPFDMHAGWKPFTGGLFVFIALAIGFKSIATIVTKFAQKKSMRRDSNRDQSEADEDQ